MSAACPHVGGHVDALDAIVTAADTVVGVVPIDLVAGLQLQDFFVRHFMLK
jgi:hypothetical protein